jgi:hypothetical protein
MKPDFDFINKYRVYISIFIVIILIVAVWSFMLSRKEDEVSKNIYFVYYDTSDFITVLDDTITFQEGEVYEGNYEFESTVCYVHIAFLYSEDRYIGGNDEIEYTIIPPSEVENLSEDFLTQHYSANSFAANHGTEVNTLNLHEYSIIRASSNESAVNFYLENTNLTIGSGKWSLQIEYIGDGSLNLDNGGEIQVRFEYQKAQNWRAEKIEDIDLEDFDYHEAP